MTKGLQGRNVDAATREKTAIEDNQRKLRAKRADEGIEWKPRFFELVDDSWTLKGR